MPITFTKSHVKQMIEVLDMDHENIEDAAKAVLDAAYEIVRDRAKFTVVGQVKPNGDKVALRWHATEKQAMEDALALTMSNQTKEEARVWILPIHNGTPASWYSKRKAQALSDEETNYREAELARRAKWIEEHPDTPLPAEWTIHVPFVSETVECSACHGLGKVPVDHLPTRADIERGNNNG